MYRYSRIEVYSLRLAMFFNVLSKPFITSPVFQMCFDKKYFVGLDLLSPGRDDGGDGSNTGRSEWRMQFTIRYIIRHWYGTRFLLLCVKTCALRFYRSAANPSSPHTDAAAVHPRVHTCGRRTAPSTLPGVAIGYRTFCPLPLSRPSPVNSIIYTCLGIIVYVLYNAI